MLWRIVDSICMWYGQKGVSFFYLGFGCHDYMSSLPMWGCGNVNASFFLCLFPKPLLLGFYQSPWILIKASFLSTWLSGSLTRLQLHLTSWRFDLSCHLPTYPLTRRNPIFIPLLLQLDSFWKNNFYVTYGIIQFSIWIIIYLDILVGGTNYCNDLRNNYLGHISKLKINYF